MTGTPIFTTVVAGRRPAHQVAVVLARKAPGALHRTIGDAVRVRGRRPRRPAPTGSSAAPSSRRSVPRNRSPTVPRSTAAGYASLFDQNLFNRYFVGRYTATADRAGIDRALAAVPQLGVPTGPAPPVELDRLEQIDWLPIALAALLAGFAVLAVGHGVVTRVRRRRRELAVLKTIGFERRQVRATVAWQATTLGVAGVLFGLPLGAVGGSRRLARGCRRAGRGSRPHGTPAGNGGGGGGRARGGEPGGVVAGAGGGPHPSRGWRSARSEGLTVVLPIWQSYCHERDVGAGGAGRGGAGAGARGSRGTARRRATT